MEDTTPAGRPIIDREKVRGITHLSAANLNSFCADRPVPHTHIHKSRNLSPSKPIRGRSIADN